MSELIKKNYNSKLQEIANRSFREQIRDTGGHLLVLRDLDIYVKILNSHGLGFTQDQVSKVYKVAVQRAKGLSKGFKSRNPVKYGMYSRKSDTQRLIRPGELMQTAFLLSNENSANLIKKTILDEFFNMSGDLSADSRKGISKSVQKSSAQSVSYVDVAGGLRAISKKFGTKKLKDLITLGIEEGSYTFETNKQAKALQRLVTNFEQVITPTGELRANYVSVLTFQDELSIIKNSPMEKRFKQLFFKEVAPSLVKHLIDKKNPNSITTQVDSKLVDILVGHKRSHTKTERKSKKANQQVKGRSVINNGKQSLVTANKNKTKGLPNLTSDKRPTTNLRSLIPILNQRLPKAIQEFMGSPRLNYRTGRFANSARITDIRTTSDGHPSVHYTYQKDPYQIFEPSSGSSLASSERDPKGLIDMSIRDIARGLITQRFYTKRV